jgi:hypothetical protein
VGAGVGQGGGRGGVGRAKVQAEVSMCVFLMQASDALTAVCAIAMHPAY